MKGATMADQLLTEEEMAALKGDIAVFRARHTMSKGRFGLMAVNSNGFVTAINYGRRVRKGTEARVRAWMNEYDMEARESDAALIATIRKHDYVMMDGGAPILPGGRPLSLDSIVRLITSGKLVAQGDDMFDPRYSQTFRLSEHADDTGDAHVGR